jgi:hypothetical protein
MESHNPNVPVTTKPKTTEEVDCRSHLIRPGAGSIRKTLTPGWVHEEFQVDAWNENDMGRTAGKSLETGKKPGEILEETLIFPVSWLKKPIHCHVSHR